MKYFKNISKKVIVVLTQYFRVAHYLLIFRFLISPFLLSQSRF